MTNSVRAGKRIVVGLSAVLAFIFQAGAGVCVWKGDVDGNGAMAVPGNWEGGAAPATGDAVVIPGSDVARTITNDLEETVELDSIQILDANRGKVTFAGEKTLTLTGATAWICTNAIEVCFPLTLKPTGSTVTLFACCSATSGEVVFRKAVTLIGDNKTFKSQVGNNSAGFCGGKVHYYGPVTTSKLSDIKNVSPSYGVETHLHDRVVTRTLSDNGYEQGYWNLHSTENDYDEISVAWGQRVIAQGANVFAAGAPLGFQKTGGVSANNGYYDLNGFDQTANRVISYADGAAGAIPPGIVTSAKAATLTLRGTASARTVAAVNGAVTVVWDPTDDAHVQEFANRASATTGDLIVKRGKIRLSEATTFANVGGIRMSAGAGFELDVTAANALAGLKTLELGENAAFSVGASAAMPFGSGQAQAVLAKGAKISIAAERTANFSRVAYDGQTVTSGIYTRDGANGTKVAPWIDGDGTVVVDASALTGYVWKLAVSGNWEDAENWAGGVVPSAATADEVCIDAAGGDFTVSVADGTTLPKKLKLCNVAGGTVTLDVAGDRAAVPSPSWTVSKGGRIRLGTGGSLTCDFKDGGQFVLERGARICVEGGYGVLTNMHNARTCNFVLGGESSATSGVQMTSGRFVLSCYDSSGPVVLNPFSRIDVSGGVLGVQNVNGINPLKFAGGVLDISGTGVLDTMGTEASASYLTFQNGTTVFSGSSEFRTSTQSYDNAYPQILPLDGCEARVCFEDHAIQKDCSCSWIVGNVAGGRGYLEYASDREHGYWDIGNKVRFIGRKVVLGGVRGYGEMSVEDGSVGVGWGGLFVGAPTDATKKESMAFEGSEGVLKVSGGTLEVQGYYGTGWANRMISGFCIGYGGAIPDGFTPSGRPYRGRVEMTGGSLGVRWGLFVLGTGYGSGTFVQTGGEAVLSSADSNNANSLLVGFAGGEGAYVISNGVFRTVQNVYVGGIGTNVLQKQTAAMVEAGNLPIHLHDAIGTVSVAGGEFMVTNRAQTARMVLGADGVGTLERIGADGVCRVSNLVLSNTVENASSGGTLRFVFDAQNGLGPVEVEKSLVIGNGAKVEVELGSYEPTRGRLPLLTAASVTGAVDPREVSITGVCANRAHVVQSTDGLCLKVDRGAIILIR